MFFVSWLLRLREALLPLKSLTQEITKMSAALDRLKVEVSEMKTATDSAVALIGGLAAQIRDLKDDPVAIAALADELDASQAKIAEAVVANTPVEGEVVAE